MGRSAKDGNALDALVLLDDPTFPGCWITARAVTVLWIENDKGPDAKVICVPDSDSPWQRVADLADLPDELRMEIQHFFDAYEVLEPNKHSSTRGWGDAAEALAEIESSRARYLG